MGVVEAAFDGVVLGVAMTGFAFSGSERGLRPGDLAGDFAGNLVFACEAVKGVIARVRGLAGAILPLICVSDSDV